MEQSQYMITILERLYNSSIYTNKHIGAIKYIAQRNLFVDGIVEYSTIKKNKEIVAKSDLIRS